MRQNQQLDGMFFRAIDRHQGHLDSATRGPQNITAANYNIEKIAISVSTF